jgi:hypothetical protein
MSLAALQLQFAKSQLAGRLIPSPSVTVATRWLGSTDPKLDLPRNSKFQGELSVELSVNSHEECIREAEEGDRLASLANTLATRNMMRWLHFSGASWQKRRRTGKKSGGAARRSPTAARPIAGSDDQI